MKRVLILSLAVFATIAFSCSKQTKSDYASISFFIGDVTKNGAVISIGDIVSEKDTIVTGAQSSCDIKLGDSIIRIKDKSKMEFSALGLKNSLENTTLDLGEGRMLCKPKKLLKNESFMVKTPTAVAAVRGTEFTVESDAAQTTRIKVYDGKVKVAKRIKPLEDKIDKIIESSASIGTKESVVVTQKETADAAKNVETYLAQNKSADAASIMAKVQTEAAVTQKDVKAFKVEDFKQENSELIAVKEKEPAIVKQITRIIKEEKPVPDGRLLITRYEIYFIKNGRVEWEGKVITPPLKDKDKVYIATEDYVFCASAEGPVLWKKQLINDGKIDIKEGKATIFVKGAPQVFDAGTGKTKL